MCERKPQPPWRSGKKVANVGRHLQRLQPFDFCTLALERHGYIAKETAALIRKLATLKAKAFELDASEEIRKWYTVMVLASWRRSLAQDPQHVRSFVKPDLRLPIEEVENLP